MNDTEMLQWVAEHLVSFRPVIDFATITYIDNEGVTRECRFNAESPTSDIELLIGCITEAVNTCKNEKEN